MATRATEKSEDSVALRLGVSERRDEVYVGSGVRAPSRQRRS